MRWAIDLQVCQWVTPDSRAWWQALSALASQLGPQNVVWLQRGDWLDLSPWVTHGDGHDNALVTLPLEREPGWDVDWQAAAAAAWWAEIDARRIDVVLLPQVASIRRLGAIDLLPADVVSLDVVSADPGATGSLGESANVVTSTAVRNRVPAYRLRLHPSSASPASRSLSWHCVGSQRGDEASAFNDLAALVSDAREQCALQAVSARRLRLAWVSPLPPVASGIADFAAELLPAMTRHYDVTAVVAQDAPPECLGPDVSLMSVATFRQEAEQFDRVLYHFGNSPWHLDMLTLLRDIPGVVVLHDVYLGHLVAHADHGGRVPQALRRALWLENGFAALQHWRDQGEASALQQYACCADIVAQSRGLIVHSQHSLAAVTQRLQGRLPVTARTVPLAQALPVDPVGRQAARIRLGLEPDEFVFCAFGYAGPGKMSVSLVQAFRQFRERHTDNPRVRLVLAGDHQMAGEAAAALDAELALTPTAHLTGRLEPDVYRQWLAAADVAVQLRARSRGETSRAVLEAMAHGLPLLVNRHGANGELVGDAAVVLPAEPSVTAIADALTQLWQAASTERDRLAQAGYARVTAHHLPDRVAGLYADAIEAAWQAPSATGADLAWVHQLARTPRRLEWHVAHRWARVRTQARSPSEAGWLGRFTPPLQAICRQPRHAIGAERDAACDVVMISGARIEDPHCGADYRAHRLRAACLAEGWSVQAVSPVDLAALPSPPHGANRRVWIVDSPEAWAAWRRLSSTGLPSQVVVYAPVRPPDRASVAHAQAVSEADCVVLPSAQGHWQADWRAAGARAVMLAPAAVPWLAPAAIRDAIAHDHLPSEPYAVLAGSDQSAAVQAAEALLLPSLAWLPPRQCLLLVGAIGPALSQRPAWQRWAGINGSRVRVLGEVAAQTWDAVRAHARVHVVPRQAEMAAHAAPSTRMLDALAGPAHVLATSAAMAGLERGVGRAPGVVLADRPAEFQAALRCLLHSPLPPARVTPPDGLDGVEGMLTRVRELCAIHPARLA